VINPDLKKVFEFLTQAEPDEKIPGCDALFVFGTNTGDVARHAASLYRQGKAPRMVISGSHRHDRTEGPFGFPSEAEYMASIAEKEGLPKEKIILETKATNTHENTVFGMQACKDAGFFPKSLILVAVPYLLRRARAGFTKNFPDIKIYGSAMPVAEDFFTPYRIKRIKGELPRLIKYAESGTIIATAIPDDIKKSAELL